MVFHFWPQVLIISRETVLVFRMCSSHVTAPWVGPQTPHLTSTCTHLLHQGCASPSSQTGSVGENGVAQGNA